MLAVSGVFLVVFFFFFPSFNVQCLIRCTYCKYTYTGLDWGAKRLLMPAALTSREINLFLPPPPFLKAEKRATMIYTCLTEHGQWTCFFSSCTVPVQKKIIDITWLRINALNENHFFSHVKFSRKKTLHVEIFFTRWNFQKKKFHRVYNDTGEERLLFTAHGWYSLPPPLSNNNCPSACQPIISGVIYEWL